MINYEYHDTSSYRGKVLMTIQINHKKKRVGRPERVERCEAARAPQEKHGLKRREMVFSF